MGVEHQPVIINCPESLVELPRPGNPFFHKSPFFEGHGTSRSCGDEETSLALAGQTFCCGVLLQGVLVGLAINLMMIPNLEAL